MRHLQRGRKLNRNTAHRTSLLQNLASELLARERIATTVAKAKELRPMAERLITLARRGAAYLDATQSADAKTQRAARVKALHIRRLLMRRLGGKKWVVVKDKRVNVVDKLINDLGPRFQLRPGGYTRVIKLTRRRLGDAAPTAIIELLRADVAPKPADPSASKGQK
jgi:large subunit ribosomal protein L17